MHVKTGREGERQIARRSGRLIPVWRVAQFHRTLAVNPPAIIQSDKKYAGVVYVD
jgi:hypothetical protein